jgi:hypothetical protein
MTEAEWLTRTDPHWMLGSLEGSTSDRKLRLFSCACCRRIWPLMTDDRTKRVVEVVERWVEGQATDLEMRFAAHDAFASKRYLPGGQFGFELDAAVEAAWEPGDAFGGCYHAQHVAYHAFFAAGEVESEHVGQIFLIEDIFGNPFRPVTLDPSWLPPAVVSLARTIYDERAFDRMPQLGDALGTCGCDNADVLKHCRDGGEHVRGCWVVDLVLGRS